MIRGGSLGCRTTATADGAGDRRKPVEATATTAAGVTITGAAATATSSRGVAASTAAARCWPWPRASEATVLVAATQE